MGDLVAQRGRHDTEHARTAARVDALPLPADHAMAHRTGARRRPLSVRLRRAKGVALRLTHHEFWPVQLFLMPLVPWILWLSVRHGGLRVCSCANPGIANGGGMMGESKSDILGAIRESDAVLYARLIEAGGTPEERARTATDLIESDDLLGGYPVILKPESGERGYGVALVRGPGEVSRYFRRFETPVIVQRYDPGPCEFGVFWIRDVGSIDGDGQTPCGEIFSVTRKAFPEVVGDGTRTLEQLILDHNRYRKQAGLFLRRHSQRLDWTPPAGERVVLGHAGNHAQGAIFSDGSDLATPELAARIDEITRSFRGIGGGAFDYGRMDLRCPSEEDFRAGRNLSIIELNGVFSESTNMYDPKRSLFWAYRVLFAQWERLYRIGAARKRQGVRPIGVRELIRLIREHRASRRTPWTGA